MDIPILYEDNHLLVVEKPINVPVQEDKSQDKDLLTMLKKMIKIRDEKPGNVFLGLVHRLDRPVDRKSTRLNSSHVAISYAVFCLKKKKTKDKVVDNNNHNICDSEQHS